MPIAYRLGKSIVAAFLEADLRRRIPASYIRFLWFMAVIGTALIALLAGQGYASVYLSTLPHTGLDGTAYVAFWTINVNVLLLVSHWILEEKVRSRALLFVIKYYYFLVSQYNVNCVRVTLSYQLTFTLSQVYFMFVFRPGANPPFTMEYELNFLFHFAASTEIFLHDCEVLINLP